MQRNSEFSTAYQGTLFE